MKNWKKECDELKIEHQDFEHNLEMAKCKVCEVVLWQIKSLKEHFSEYIENTCDHVFDQIQVHCEAFLDGHCPCKSSERRGTETLANL